MPRPTIRAVRITAIALLTHLFGVIPPDASAQSTLKYGIECQSSLSGDMFIPNGESPTPGERLIRSGVLKEGPEGVDLVLLNGQLISHTSVPDHDNLYFREEQRVDTYAALSCEAGSCRFEIVKLGSVYEGSHWTYDLESNEWQDAPDPEGISFQRTRESPRLLDETTATIPRAGQGAVTITRAVHVADDRPLFHEAPLHSREGHEVTVNCSITLRRAD